MREMRKVGPMVLGLFLLAAGVAHAGSQNICANLSLSNFNNSSIIAGYRVTDIGAAFHQCSPGSSNSCSACAGAKSYPKNVGNYLCLPSTLLYSISSSCQSLLSSGSGNCKKNNTQGAVCKGQSVVMPACNWRTNDNENQTTWSWSLSLSGSTVVVDCSQSNYQGYQQ